MQAKEKARMSRAFLYCTTKLFSVFEDYKSFRPLTSNIECNKLL